MYLFCLETCSSLQCSDNSTCKNTNPSSCRCKTGYIYIPTENKCKSGEIVAVDNLHLDLPYNTSYANTSSTEFAKFAVKFEATMEKFINDTVKANIIGVQLIGAREGLVVKFLVIYDNSFTNTSYLITQLSLISNSSSGLSVLKVKSDETPTASGKSLHFVY